MIGPAVRQDGDAGYRHSPQQGLQESRESHFSEWGRVNDKVETCTRCTLLLVFPYGVRQLSATEPYRRRASVTRSVGS